MQRSLLHWYASNQRNLPWRKKRDPYWIMVSEFMLQQTRVETVLPYFERFLKERKALRRMLQKDFGLKVKIKGPLPPQKHSFTHIQVTMKPFLCSVVRLSSALPVSKNVRWIKPVNFSRYPISKAMSKIAALILDPSPREATSG